MIALAECTHKNRRKHGRDRRGNRRFRCADCNKTFTDPKTRPLGQIHTSMDKSEMALKMLLEGMAVRAVSRITRLDKNTVLRIMETGGDNCERFMEKRLVDLEASALEASALEADQIWDFVQAKQKTCDRLGKRNAGGFYTYAAIDPKSKLLVSWHVGRRDDYNTDVFAEKVSKAVTGRFQLSTDGFNCYKSAVPNRLVGRCDYGIVVKIFGAPSQEEQRKYSPSKIKEIKKSSYMGRPDEFKICTSRTERHNLSIRTHVRRFTRLTNAFSKTVDNHRRMTALFFCWYNFCRGPMSLDNRTPAQAHGLTDRKWTLRELLENAADC